MLVSKQFNDQKALYVVLFLFLFFSFISVPARAAILPDCAGVATDKTRACEVNDIFDLLVNIYNFLLGLAAFVAMLIIVWAGIRMFLYHWFENPEQELQGAKFALTRAIWGLVIVAAAYLIVNTLLAILGVKSDTAIGILIQGLGFTLP